MSLVVRNAIKETHLKVVIGMLKVERLLFSDRMIIIYFAQDLKETEIITTGWSFEIQLFINLLS